MRRTMMNNLVFLKQILVVILICIAVMVISYQIGVSHGYRAAQFECSCHNGQEQNIGRVVLADDMDVLLDQLSSRNGVNDKYSHENEHDEIKRSHSDVKNLGLSTTTEYSIRKIRKKWAKPTDPPLPHIPVFSDEIEMLQAKLHNTSHSIDRLGLTGKSFSNNKKSKNETVPKTLTSSTKEDSRNSSLQSTTEMPISLPSNNLFKKSSQEREGWEKTSIQLSVTKGAVTVANNISSSKIENENKKTYGQQKENNIPEPAGKVPDDTPLETPKPFVLEPTTVTITSQPRPRIHYGVFGCTYPIDGNLNYVFGLPMTVRAWRRIGYGSIVILTGRKQEWLKLRYLYLVLKELEHLEAILIFIDTLPEHNVMISQTSRLFAANMLDWSGKEDSVIVTSDADLWPLNDSIFDLPEGKDIMFLNSECCGEFSHKNRNYKLLPMAYVVASVRTWRAIININGEQPKNNAEIIEYFYKEFGDIVLQPVSKGENDGWYLDQHMLSVRYYQRQYIRPESALLVPRNIPRDRLCRSAWVPLGSLEGKNDVHVLDDMYKPVNWERMRNILSLMYYAQAAMHCNSYRDKFVHILIEEGLVHF